MKETKNPLMIKPLVEKLASELGLAVPFPMEDGSFEFDFEPAIRVKVKENAEKGIVLSTKLSQASQEKNEELFSSLMEANLFGRETGGNTLGLDREGKVITLSSFLPEEVSYLDFHEAIENFVNYAEVWRDDLVQMQKGMKR